VDNTEELAVAVKAKWDLGLKGGIVIANPIPEQYEMDYDVITRAINEAIREAEIKGIKGKESTPYLLAKVKEITGGKSLEANIQLVYNNARVGAQLAFGLAKLRS
jgi:pseudouridine-5'-phosphate glycosidase